MFCRSKTASVVKEVFDARCLRAEDMSIVAMLLKALFFQASERLKFRSRNSFHEINLAVKVKGVLEPP